MKHWKRLLSCVLAGSVALALAACGQQSAGSSSAGNQSTSQSTDQSREEVSSAAQSSAGSGADASGTESGAGNGSVLVVYYSATGNTENAASYIAQATGGDLFAITPADPYTSADLDWTDADSRVVYEYENPEERDVALAQETPTGWDDYDVVFLGYPICTSSSSGLGESGDLLAELADAGTWLEGQRFRGGASQTDVAAWVESLDLS